MNKEASVDIGLLPDPEYFLHTGSYSLNRLMSGKFEGGPPQGRLVGIGGHSSSGKSLVGATVLAQNIKNGGYGIVVDSEGAVDNRFLKGVGFDPEDPQYEGQFTRMGTSKISQCSKVVNKFIKDYVENEEDTPTVILIDSLDMLFTDSEQDSIESKGDLGGDQGQRAKQLKRMLLSWTHSICRLPITIICSKQVYVEQDQFKAYEEPWVFTESLKYPFSQIVIVEKLQYKDKNTKEHMGFTLKAKSYKNRHAKEKQVARIAVPFSNGLDPYAGLLEIAEQFGVIVKNGAWYSFKNGEGNKFQRKSVESDPKMMELILDLCKQANDEEVGLDANLEDYISELESPSASKESATEKRKRKVLEEGFQDDKDEDKNE